ncbi:hypothetical protein MPER_15430 [Moniliophthora perniciosa FA553]|nr:hypothetical protein MPER_15430 [Moniliophthora perniciosa FA553]
MSNESNAISALGPIDPASVNQGDGEKEKAAPWVVRKLAGSDWNQRYLPFTVIVATK